MELICSWTVQVGKKGIGENNHPAGLVHWKKEGHVLFLCEKELGQVCVLFKELNVQLVSFGKRLLTQPCFLLDFFKLPVLWQFYCGTFQTLPSPVWGNLSCTWIGVGVYLFFFHFLYCTFKHEYLSVYRKTERGDGQRKAWRLRTITH